jgi:hypothetical protein
MAGKLWASSRRTTARIPDELWSEMDRLLRRMLASLAVEHLRRALTQALCLDKGYRVQ